MEPELGSYIDRREAALAAVRTILIDNLGYQAEPQEIDADAPLFGTGLGLDSVDALELVVAVEAGFGVTLPENALRERLRTLNTLVDLLLQRQDERSEA
ncbi:MAG: acyl carrier protein [Deltaproteobacteria bacterium]|nr:acyl carrier protein [Deltaproteobacteria bacterium]